MTELNHLLHRQFRTRDGSCKARIVCVDSNDPVYPIVALVTSEDIEYPTIYTAELKVAALGQSDFDLIEVPAHETDLNEFVLWLQERLVHVYGENANVDFVKRMNILHQRLTELEQLEAMNASL